MKKQSFKDSFAEDGYNDFLDGAEIEDCPWDEGTDGQFGWLKGWHKAEKLSKEDFHDQKRED